MKKNKFVDDKLIREIKKPAGVPVFAPKRVKDIFKLPNPPKDWSKIRLPP
jgi:hypothetical protein